MFNTWPIIKRNNRLYFIMVVNVLIKFGRDPTKIVGGVTFLKFPAPYGPVFTKKFKMPPNFINLAHHQEK